VVREFTHAADILSSASLLNVRLGKHVRQSLEKDWMVLFGADCWQEEFAAFIYGFFERYSPLTRIRRTVEQEVPGED
ncbi:MAG: hypothetical protein NTV84_01535, partial [Methanoregula sp.]|nr:hypothetical protein [Methanoregula sp.]